MNPQNTTASSPRMAAWPTEPFSFVFARARMLCHFGESRWRKLGVRTFSGIEYVYEFSCCVFSRKPEEDILQSSVAFLRRGAKFSHRAERANLSVLNDSNSIAHAL